MDPIINTKAITKFVLHFNKFFEMFSNDFIVHHRNVAPAAKSYVDGLMQDIRRKNIERINEQVPECKYDAQHNVISVSPWSHQTLNRHIAVEVNKLVGGENSTFIIDNSEYHKSGKNSVGVARQRNGRLGKTDNCQSAVFATLSKKDHQAIIGNRLYLHKNWTSNPKRCEKAGIPPEHRQHKTKPQLALELVDEALEAGVKFGNVAADAVYGSSEFSHELEKRHLLFTLDIRSNNRVYPRHPEPYIPERRGMNGRSRTVMKSDVPTIRVSTIAKRIKKDQWQRVRVWKGTDGYIEVDAACKRVYFWNAKHHYEPLELWLVMIREIGSKEVEFFMSNHSADTPLKTLVAKRRARYWVERSFQDSKTNIGMADYQVRKWQGWQHHMSLCMLALLFMLTLKDINKEDIPMLTAEDIVLALDYYLPKRILTEEDLINAIKTRHKKRLNAELSALRCQKRKKSLQAKVPK